MVVPSFTVIVLILFSPEFGVCEARRLSVDGGTASAVDLNPIAATVAAPSQQDLTSGQHSASGSAGAVECSYFWSAVIFRS